MTYEVKVTRQGQTTIPKPLRAKYMIDEGDRVMYVDLGDHMAVLPVPNSAVKTLAGLKIDARQSVHKMKKEALDTAQRLARKKLEG